MPTLAILAIVLICIWTPTVGIQEWNFQRPPLNLKIMRRLRRRFGDQFRGLRPFNRPDLLGMGINACENQTFIFTVRPWLYQRCWWIEPAGLFHSETFTQSQSRARHAGCIAPHRSISIAIDPGVTLSLPVSGMSCHSNRTCRSPRTLLTIDLVGCFVWWSAMAGDYSNWNRCTQAATQAKTILIEPTSLNSKQTSGNHNKKV